MGERGGAVLGSAYFLQAVKRVRGRRLIGLAKQERRKAHGAPAVVANRRRDNMLGQLQDEKIDG